MIWNSWDVKSSISSLGWSRSSSIVWSRLLDLDVLLLAGDLEGFGSLLGALRARHEEIHYIFDPA